MRQMVSLGVLALLGALLASGCTSSAAADHQPSDSWTVGDTVALPSGADVTLVSATTTPPPDWRRGHYATREGPPLWLVFEVTNSTDASLSVPNRPVRPRVEAADGTQLRKRGSSAYLDGGGGGWGPAAGFVGGPYLDPGGTMHVTYELEGADAARPFTVEYAPLYVESAIFLVY